MKERRLDAPALSAYSLARLGMRGDGRDSAEP